MRTIQPYRQKAEARWRVGLRQIVETVYEKLFHTSRLDREHPTDHDAARYIELLPGVPIVESPFFENILASGYFNDWEKPIATDLHQKGYAVFDYPDPDISVRAQRIRFFENCAYYTPMASHMIAGKIAFRDPMNVCTRRPVSSSHAEQPLPSDYVAQCKQRVLVSPDEVMADTLPEDFDSARYLELHPDVAEAGMDPAYHYMTHGRFEGRNFK